VSKREREQASASGRAAGCEAGAAGGEGGAGEQRSSCKGRGAQGELWLVRQGYCLHASSWLVLLFALLILLLLCRPLQWMLPLLVLLLQCLRL
jgi:hypothetical protein